MTLKTKNAGMTSRDVLLCLFTFGAAFGLSYYLTRKFPENASAAEEDEMTYDSMVGDEDLDLGTFSASEKNDLVNEPVE